MKKSFILIALLFSFVIGFCQKKDIQLYKTFGGLRFEQDSAALSVNEVLNLMKDNPDAYNEMRVAKKNQSWASILGFCGGILVGFPVGTAIAGGEPEWAMAAAGASLWLLSIPLSNSYKDHSARAVDLYNKKFSARINTQLYISGPSAKVVIRF